MQVSISIDDELIGQIDVIAKQKGRSRSNMIKFLIKDYLKKHNYDKQEFEIQTGGRVNDL